MVALRFTVCPPNDSEAMAWVTDKAINWLVGDQKLTPAFTAGAAKKVLPEASAVALLVADKDSMTYWACIPKPSENPKSRSEPTWLKAP